MVDTDLLTSCSDEDLLLRLQIMPGATPAADRIRVRLGVLPVVMRGVRTSSPMP